MKLRVIILLILFIGASGFNIIKTFELNNPSLKIVLEDCKNNKAGDMIIYSVRLCSVDNLKTFSISPNIKGENEDSFVKFEFDENTKQAVLNYYYIIPKIKNKQIVLNFTLTDNKSTIKEQKYINVK